VTTSDISEFWIWFASVSGDFGARFENASLLKELDLRVTALGPFTWEVGPAPNSSDSILVISPGGRAELLPETKKVVDLAPACPGWRFFSAIPPKQWDRRFFMNDSEGTRVAVDASQWRYVLHKYPDGVFDIVIYAPDLAPLAEQDRITAAEIVLDGELGEEARLSLIDGIEIVVAPVDRSVKTTPIAHVGDHLRRLAHTAGRKTKKKSNQ
jgi:hypothetical protein